MKNILQKDNKILRTDAKPAIKSDFKEIKFLIGHMAEAMFAEPDGIGIAAPQIGVSLKVFLVAEDVLYPERLANEKKRTKGYMAFINPRLIKSSRKKAKDIEGCLSVRGKYGEVERPEKVTVEYLDESGKKKTRGASGLFARVLQHEEDHLNGILFIDKAKGIQNVEAGS